MVGGVRRIVVDGGAEPDVAAGEAADSPWSSTTR